MNDLHLLNVNESNQAAIVSCQRDQRRKKERLQSDCQVFKCENRVIRYKQTKCKRHWNDHHRSNRLTNRMDTFFNLQNEIWINNKTFDITYHVEQLISLMKWVGQFGHRAQKKVRRKTLNRFWARYWPEPNRYNMSLKSHFCLLHTGANISFCRFRCIERENGKQSWRGADRYY